MSDDSSEKQHEASGKRLSDLRKQGQTMRSRDFTSGLVFVATIIMLFSLSANLKQQFETNFISCFQFIAHIKDGNEIPPSFIQHILYQNFSMLLPIFGVLVVVTLLSPFIFGGWNFSLEAVGFKLNKLNPLNYFKNIFSVKIFIEIGRSLLKVTVIMGALLYFIMNRKNDIMNLTHLALKPAIQSGFVIMQEFIVLMSVCLIFIVLFDVVYHYFEYNNRMKMSTQELKDEMKETEGSPELKRKIRSKQFALLRQRLAQSVPSADVILTNPTHYAVALKYEDGKDKAPKVVAKGKGHLALQIRKLAVANAITIYEAPALARAVYHTTQIGGEIHPDLYMAVAIVLSYVHQLRNFQYGRGPLPNQVTEFALPEDFIYDE